MNIKRIFYVVIALLLIMVGVTLTSINFMGLEFITTATLFLFGVITLVTGFGILIMVISENEILNREEIEGLTTTQIEKRILRLETKYKSIEFMDKDRRYEYELLYRELRNRLNGNDDNEIDN